MENTFTLIKKPIGKSAIRFRYSIINDQTGEVVRVRESTRDYVAATVYGNYFFGRVDLIEKGEHKKVVAYYQNRLNTGTNFDGRPGTPTEMEEVKNALIRMKTIAYIEEYKPTSIKTSVAGKDYTVVFPK